MMDDVSNGMHNVSDGVRDMVDRNDEANTEDLTDNEYPRQEDVYTASNDEDLVPAADLHDEVVSSEQEIDTDDGISGALTQREEEPIEEEVVEEESPQEPLDSQDEPRV